MSPILQAGQQLWSTVREGAARWQPESSAPPPPRQLTDMERARLFAASVLEESDDYEKKTMNVGAKMNQWFGSWSTTSS
jgi:hypothetical protein